jgi:hypothetical protein
METNNTSVSPPPNTRQSFRSFGHEDRNEIIRRAQADLSRLYADLGGRSRGKILYCIFHDDGTPSASFHNGRFRCFACGVSFDVIELVQRALGTDFKDALAYLSDRYGVPLHPWRLPPVERARFAQQRRRLERNLPDALRWQRAAILITDTHLDELKAPLADPALGPTDWQEIPRVEQRLARLRRLTGRALVDEYHACRERHPLLATAIVQFATRFEVIRQRALLGYWDALEAHS